MNDDHGVIFDCDGVLVDSERLAAGVVDEMTAALGIRFTDGPTLEFIRGRKVADWVDDIATAAGHPLPADFVATFRARCAEAFDAALEPVDGVADVLAGLDAPFCCASSSPRDAIEHALETTGLRAAFGDRVHSAYELGSWKPEPDLFLNAARDLGVSPERCAVVEDSVPGVQAGVRAGMTVFGYAPGGTAATLRAHGATPFPAMGELPTLLDHWRAGLPPHESPITTDTGQESVDVPARP